MKYSEEIALRLKGVKSDEIAALKEAEAAELAEAQAAQQAAEESKIEELTGTLTDAQKMIEALEEKLQLKEQEVLSLNEKVASFNNKVTQAPEPKAAKAEDVMAQLFKPNKED